MFNNMKVGSRLMLLVGILAIFLVVVGALGLRGMAIAIGGLKTVYEDRTVSLVDLGEINKLFRTNVTEIFRAMQHNPGNELAQLHDHPIGVHLGAIDGNIAKLDARWAKYMATYLTPEEKNLAEDFEKKHKEFDTAILLPILQALKKNDFSLETEKIFIVEGRKYGKAMGDALDALIALQDRVAKEEFDSASSQYALARIVSIAAIITGLALGIILAFWIIRSITRPLGRAMVIAENIANGDLTNRIEAGGGDETGQLLQSLATMQLNLRQMTAEISTNADQLASAASQLASTSDQVAQSTIVQSNAAAAMASAVEEVTVSIDQVAERAREAHVISSRSGELSNQGSTVILNAASEMKKIADSVRDSSTIILQLEQQSGEISAIVQVIKEIADQTNLLALNAAIEAARAGEQGRGFAVVADEVRKLAERTTKSTQEIASMIAVIQDGTRNAVKSMEMGVEQVNGGVTLAGQAGESITEIKSSTNQVAQVVDDISAALREQSVASNDIAQNVEKIAQMSEENNAAVQETLNAVEHLEQLASSLQNSIGRFKL